MEYKLPKRISNEKDLTIYENYIEKNNFKINTQTTNQEMTIYQGLKNLNEYLNNLKGKLIKVESMINNQSSSRIGILLDIGTDYLVLKLNISCCSLIIPLNTVKYITVVHDNNRFKAARL